MSDKTRAEVRHLQDALIELILSETDEEVLSALQAEGTDINEEAGAMRAAIARAAGKARMAAAKAKLKAQAMPAIPVDNMPAANDDLVHAQRLTKAARNGGEQSDDDVRTAAHDLREIEAFQRAREKPNP